MKVPDADCVPCGPLTREDPDLSGFGFRIGLSLAFAGQGMVFGLGYNNALRAGEAPAPGSLFYALLHAAFILSSLAVVFLLGRPLLRQTLRSIKQRRLTVEALFVLSGLGAFGGSLISTIRGNGSVYYEVVSIVLCVYAIGKQIGVVQKGRIGGAVAAFRHAFDTAIIRGPDGARQSVPVSSLKAEDTVLIQPGDPIPVDGEILSGSGYIRETTLTGEPAPISKGPGDTVMAGTWSVDGNLVLKTRPGKERAIDAILRMLDSAPPEVSNLQAHADRLMQVFVPVVSLTAAGTFLGWLILSSAPWWDALFNAMAVLLVACPCALGLAMPAGIWGGLFYLSQRGIVGRSGHLIDTLAECDLVVFDKTGTLSEMELLADADSFCPADADRAIILAGVARMASQSAHPVSKALAGIAEPAGQLESMEVFPGLGLGARVDGRAFLVGEASLLELKGVPAGKNCTGPGKPVQVAVDGIHRGTLRLNERLRPDAVAALEGLESLGCETRILSGDPAPEQEMIGPARVQAGLSPQQKADLLREWRPNGEGILFIGDGINDLPAMEASQSALAIDLGAALATEYADGLLVEGRVASLPSAVRYARRLKGSLAGNLRFALTYNLIGMALAAAGILHPVVAALLMVGSSAVVSYRALRVAGLRQ